MKLFFLSVFCFGQVLIGSEIADVINQFEKIVEKERETWKVPGVAIGIVKDGKAVFIKGFGQQGLDNTQPVDEDTLFQIGSLSKAFTTTLAAIGVDEGLFDWSDPVSELNHLFTLNDAWVTRQFQIVDLFSQRSGLPPYAGDEQLFLGFSQEEILNHLRFIQPITSFRSTYAYQNVFFIEGAKLLEKKTGKNYQKLLQEKIFTPLNMKDSSATLQTYLNSQNKADWILKNSQGTFTTIPFDFKSNEWSYIAAPAGGINSTIKDMSQWLILQTNLGVFNNKTLVSKENLQKTHQPFVSIGNLAEMPAYYCLGWVYLQHSPYPIIFHDGSTLGVYNVIGMVPEERLGIVILTNGRGAELSLALMLQFFDLYYKKEEKNWSQFFLDKHEPKHKPPSTHSPTSLTEYQGTYTNPIYGEAVVTLQGAQLSLTIGKNKSVFSLNPLAENLFSFDWFPVEIEPVKVAFSIDYEGQISQMSIESIEKSGGGTFIRS